MGAGHTRAYLLPSVRQSLALDAVLIAETHLLLELGTPLRERRGEI